MSSIPTAMKRYVALGSSMAAGPGISPRAPGAPRGSGRSARNYPHLVAERLNLDLVDVTYSGATTAAVLTDYQRGAPPQICALDGSEALVTVTIGGNDVGYIPLLIVASLPNFARRLPMLRGWVADLLDRDARDRALATVFDSLCEVGRSIRKRSPNARVLFVDYLTLLPPAGVGAPPLSEDDAALGRHVAETLERLTAEAAVETGCEIVRAAAASRDHHAWSVQPWAEKTGRLARYVVPLPGRPAPLHPNEAGMHAVARAITAQWGR
ncbi:hydrolase [Mycobacterium marinum]|nr:hydrolase [Mycobacterium marinum]GJP09962.1 hydrolase [Mycobacterium marinum]CDM74818.1 conserved hypothetical hydrolase [Mycobacterium marinum E11]